MLLAITGCNGFIGREVAEYFLLKGYWVYGIDNETYAADTHVPQHLTNVANKNGTVFKYIKADIATIEYLPDVDAIINLAAETHVDNSIIDPERFIHSNVFGVYNLLELIRAKEAYKMPRFIHISTDEVYGDVPNDCVSYEDDLLRPSSPYAASKASADLFIQAYHRTYNIPFNIIRPSNCYGPYQYPEKLIPKVIRHLKWGKFIPVHNAGEMVRTWIHTTDIASAIDFVIHKGLPNTTYNIGGERHSVNHIIKQIAEIHNPLVNWKDYCTFNYTRKGMDYYYHVNDDKLRILGWTPQKEIGKELHTLYTHFYDSKRF